MDNAVNPAVSGKISVDLATRQTTIDGLKTPDYTIDHFDGSLAMSDQELSQMLSVKNRMGSTGQVTLPDLNRLVSSPLNVDNIQVRVGEDAATDAMVITQRKALQEQGITSVGLQFHDNNQVSLTGTVKRGLTLGREISFEAKGNVGVADAQHARVTLTGMHVAGIIPVPGLFQSLVLAMGEPSLNPDQVQRDGDRSFLINIASFVPKNIKMGLKAVSTEEGVMHISGGPLAQGRPAPGTASAG